MPEEQLTPDEQESLAALGDVLHSWEIDEYPKYVRSRKWYVIVTILALAFILYAIVTANFLFAVIILMVCVIFFVTAVKDPPRVPVVITSTGIVVDDKYYDWRQLKDFSVVYDPPEVSLLYIDFHSNLNPLLTIPLEAEDPNRVRQTLLPFLPENLKRRDETLTDALRRVYKF